jgi:dipeptidyl aminopeptidase/acylaminoacyl peptidase
LGTSGDVTELEGSGGNADASSRVQAVCDWYGPTDFLQMHDPNDKNHPTALLVGGPLSEHADQVKAANPITHVTKNAPPFLIMHGDSDPVVPIGQSELLDKALQAAGVEVTFRALPGAGHGGPAFGSTESRDAIAQFFAKHLK